MADIPTELQESRVFKLHMRGNGLHRFPDSELEGTGKGEIVPCSFTTFTQLLRVLMYTRIIIM